MKATWSAMRKIIAPIMFVALAATGMTVGVSTAAHADAAVAVPTVLNYSDGDALDATGTFDSWNTWSGPVSSVGIDTAPTPNGGNALKFVKGPEGYSGFSVSNGHGLVTDATHSKITFDVYNAQSSDRNVLVKLQVGGDQNGVTKFVNAVPGWSTVTADFASGPYQASTWTPATKAYNHLILMPGFGYGSAGQADGGDIFYIDNIIFNDEVYTAPSPSPTATSTAAPAPTVASIKLDSADLGPSAVYSKGNDWWEGEGNGSRNIVKYLPAGGTWTFHYTVKDTAGNAVSGAQVTLASSGDADAATTGDRTKTTDADGKVTFTFTNATSNSNAEWPRQNSNVWSLSETATVAFEFIPYISGSDRHTECYDAGNATACNRDRLWGHVVSTATYSVPAKTTIRLVEGTTVGMSDKSSWWTDSPSNRSMVKFVTAENKLVLRYQVAEGGTPVGAGRTITLAKSIISNGADFSGSLTATTNASGIATFVLTNTNTSGENRPTAPSTMNYWDNSRNPGTATEVQFSPSVSPLNTAVANYDRVWVHVVNKPSSQGVPAAPYQVTAQRSGTKQITVKWNAATEDGAANTGYEVTLTPTTGAAVVATASASATSLAVNVPSVTGYTASVKAINSAGKGAATAASGKVAPSSVAPRVPNAPTMPAAPTKGVDALWIPFIPSTVDSGATEAAYQYSLDGGLTWFDATYDSATYTDAAEIRAKKGNVLFLYNLETGKSYSVKMRAVNAIGAGAASTTKVTATATAPTKAPTLTTVSYSGTTLTIAYTGIPIASNGGTPLTSYSYSLNGGTDWIKLNASQRAASRVVITGLSASYAPFNVTVKGSNGADSPSATVKTVRTITVAPTFTVTAATGKVVLNITALSATANTSNSPVTKYQYTTNDGATWTDAAAGVTNITASKSTTVSVKVRAVNSVGAGTVSTAKSATAR
ncbi:MAG: fibronectin type III domain-containing protein [Actinobacteria bacterium]|nr:fibronectin type III domain-containing protein [Actinomycetota bacterium]NBY15346.1 fibronectin type III domain-containing protein [Actinomycetota bacterium]